MALNFHQLHIFYSVAEKGSFSAAAQSLHMTQPAVTMQIQSLEDYFGVKLFQRSTKRIEITEAGRTLLPYARRGMRLIQEAEAAMAAYSRMLAGSLQLGASLTIGEYILPRLLGRFNRDHPDITIRLKVMNTAQIVGDILNHHLNFGLVEAPIEHPDITAEAVMSDELKLIVPADHSLARAERVTPEDLFRHPIILREPGSGTRRVMEEELARKGFKASDLHIAMELGSTGAIKSAVEAGLGISLLSESAVKHEKTLGLIAVRSIDGLEFTRHFYSIYLKTSLLPLSAVTFLGYLRERGWNV
ncbi:selenium metabolism-associated LysR family transcriptional regulator [Paenibacillus thermoaerophilus]|uniref:Selenium metabolism-associated LysR family transcriptional regulator n=1 Tax=Paenibacillus thermoaerophilus TaxID=1215385 RepID=A0ABW2UXY0_9BACL|nr:selenium metabolism-associated LysR family transcriptional regulator [Paenibacillus thermoaerophilus]TMV19137.1 LysR family transcriptional regulator [Paenibacillus thermoaerophilus]